MCSLRFITSEWDRGVDGDDAPTAPFAHKAAQAIVLGISGKPEEMVHTEVVIQIVMTT